MRFPTATRRLILGLVIPLLVLATGAGGHAAERLRLATTTSTRDSGLLDDLLSPFEERRGIEVQVIAVGSGQALALGERGDADILLVHIPAREREFVEKGYGIDRRDIMWNDFVIAGPPSDPAGVRGMTDAAAALKQIADKRQRFVSRGDDSGTHNRELSLWEKVGGAPRGEDFYLEAGQGMGRCLTMADEKLAYILTDRGTYLAFKARSGLEVLVEGDPALRNPYGAMLVNPARHEHLNVDGARALLDYLTSPEGQRRIDEFRLNGKVLFHPVVVEEKGK